MCPLSSQRAPVHLIIEYLIIEYLILISKNLITEYLRTNTSPRSWKKKGASCFKCGISYLPAGLYDGYRILEDFGVEGGEL